MDNSDGSAGSERRVQKRVEVTMPFHVRGIDAHGVEFEESTEAVQVSRRGLSFLTRRELKPLAVVTLLIPGRGPNRPGVGPTDFFTTAAVINIFKEGELYRVGLRFIGATLTMYSSETV